MGARTLVRPVGQTLNMLERLQGLSLGLGNRLPMLLQTEATECGLACLGMIAGFHGRHVDLAALRTRFPVSLKGATLAGLLRIAAQLKLAARPLKLDLDNLSKLRLPCILHWNFNHFVVLREVNRQYAVIHDPATGIRKCSLDELSRSFTGVALELWPDTGFEREPARPALRLRQLLGPVTGLKRSFAQVLLLALALEVFTVVNPFFLQWVIDQVLVSADRSLLATLALGFGLLLLVQQATSAARGWMLMYVGTMLNVQWRANVFTHLLRLPVNYFEKRHLGDVVSRFGSIDTIQQTLTTSFVEALLDGVMSVVTLLLMFLYSPALAGIAVGAMALYALSRWLWYAPLRRATEERIVHAAKQQTHLLETLRGVRTIKLFERQQERRSAWLALLVEQINADLSTQKLTLLYKTLNGLLFGIENILVIWLGAQLVLDGAFTVGALIAFYAYKGQFDSRVGSLLDKLVDVRMLQLQGERLADIVFHPPEPDAQPAAFEPDIGPQPSIEVRGLRFRYGDQEPYVLDGIDLRIEPGESVAITGPSGSGKSTLIAVLLGLLQPEAGEILLDGKPLRQLGAGTMRRLAGTVLQDDVLFAGSMAENICCFDVQPDHERIRRCAELAAIHDDIAAMPMGYDTLVGDMGTVLSGGQKQRVLLARALYKQPRVLFLDEATSHLDIEREQQVNTAVLQLRMTRVIVAHRPETIASAGRRIVLAGGRVVHDSARPAMAAAEAAAAAP